VRSQHKRNRLCPRCKPLGEPRSRKRARGSGRPVVVEVMERLWRTMKCENGRCYGSTELGIVAPSLSLGAPDAKIFL